MRLPPLSHRSLRVMCAASLAVGMAPIGLSAQEPVHRLDLEPCAELCGLRLVPVGEFGEATGPGMIEGSFVWARMDDSGRTYVVGQSVPHVWVFAEDGAFVTRIGQAGEGPGEFLEIGSFAVIDDGVLAVLDGGRGVVLIYTWAGELLQEVKTRGWLPAGFETIHFEGPLAVHMADLASPDRVGFPLHLVNLESGAIQASFGSETGEYPWGSSIERVIARGPEGAVWAVSRTAYDIELWEPENRLLRLMRRNVEWFSRTAEEGHGWGVRPRSMVAGISADDSLLWVSVATPDDRWAEAGTTRDDDLFLDLRIEVIDWRRGAVVASERLDELYAWVKPGLVGRMEITSKASVRFRTYRVHLESRVGHADPGLVRRPPLPAPG